MDNPGMYTGRDVFERNNLCIYAGVALVASADREGCSGAAQLWQAALVSGFRGLPCSRGDADGY